MTSKSLVKKSSRVLGKFRVQIDEDLWKPGEARRGQAEPGEARRNQASTRVEFWWQKGARVEVEQKNDFAYVK